MKHKFLNLFLAVEISVFVEFLLMLSGIYLRLSHFYAGVVILWIFLNCTMKTSLKRSCVITFGFPLLVSLIVLAGFLSWNHLSADMNYVATDDGKASLYGDRSVMVIVPHEDDDLNIAGGILEQYRSYGSEVTVVFITNGDYYDLGHTRIDEAIRVCKYVGIEEGNVIFLGYGDQWSEDGPHIYNAEPGQMVISAAGYSSTYGTASHPAYHEDNLYTRDNLLSDIKSVILEYRPDTILCSDYDSHIDHRATTLMFERAMGEILREAPGYRPTVLKAYAYNGTWYAASDYDTLNILSTENVFESPYDQTPQIYSWNERIRLPIAADTLSRSLVRSRAYEALSFYESQDAKLRASSVVNGDRVCWQRRTDSQLYTAELEASSGEAALLHDFMLIDSEDLRDAEHPPYDGTWIPSDNDPDRTIAVRLTSATDLYELVLYDNPSEQDNILNAIITFDNGTIIETGALQPTGMGTEIVVNQLNVESFSIRLESTEGASAGLTEVEGYTNPYVSPFSYIKLMDQYGHFAYDYITAQSGVERLRLYIFGSALPELSEEGYSVACDNECCSAEIADGMVEVFCPPGEACNISIVYNADPIISDSIYIQNATAFRRIAMQYVQLSEKLAHTVIKEEIPKGSVLDRTFALAGSIVSRVWDHLN